MACWRLSQSRRGDPHHPPRGRAEARAHEALQALRDPGRGDSRNQAAPPRQARGNEDPRRAEEARRGARRARGRSLKSQGASSRSSSPSEIEADAEKYGDDRRTKIVEREAALAIDESELVANEPATIVLSKGGFVRSAKGHEIDPRTLQYKSGDEYPARGQGAQRCSRRCSWIRTGRAYSLWRTRCRRRADWVSRCRRASIRRMAPSGAA